MSETAGYIQILTNPSFPHFVKIGYADDVDRRLSELNRSKCILWSDKYSEETKLYQADGDYSLGTVANPSAVEMEDKLCLFEIDEPHKAGVIGNSATTVKKAVFKLKFLKK